MTSSPPATKFRSFLVGDYVRIGGQYQKRLPLAYRPWLRRGRIEQIIKVVSRGRGRHRMYWFTPRRGRPPVFLERFHLRPLDQRDRAARGQQVALKE